MRLNMQISHQLRFDGAQALAVMKEWGSTFDEVNYALYPFRDRNCRLVDPRN
jgi:hypothetical protein